MPEKGEPSPAVLYLLNVLSFVNSGRRLVQNESRKKKINKWESYSGCIPQKIFFSAFYNTQFTVESGCRRDCQNPGPYLFQMDTTTLGSFLTVTLGPSPGFESSCAVVLSCHRCTSVCLPLLQMICHTAQHVELLHSVQGDMRKHPINAFQMNPLVLKMMILLLSPLYSAMHEVLTV